jgi:hypothetical protein
MPTPALNASHAPWGISVRPRVVAVPASAMAIRPTRSAPKATILAAPHGGGHSVGGQNLSILKFERRTQRLRPAPATTFLRISPNGNSHNNDKENGLKHGHNDYGKTGHFYFRLDRTF